MEIKSADQILKKHIGEAMSHKGILDAMKEYAEQYIDLAIEEKFTYSVEDLTYTVVEVEDLEQLKQLIK